MSRVNKIWGKSPARYLEVYVLVLFDHGDEGTHNDEGTDGDEGTHDDEGTDCW